jgi:amino acid adenylation domain-containing protein
VNAPTPTPATTASTLTELFDHAAATHPDRLAISDDEAQLTYAELAERVEAVAAELVRHRVRAEQRIGLHLERGIGAVVAVLAVLRAGAAYVPVDVSYPRARREQMLEEGDLALVLADRGRAQRIAAPAEVVELEWRAVPAADGPLPAAPRPADAACVLFTSGTTGLPKGVVLEHRQMVAFATDPAIPAVGPGDRMAQSSSLSFDTFTFELWRSVAGGAQLVVLPSFAELIGADLQRQLRRARITAMLAPAIALNHLGRHDREALASLRLLCSGGDVLLADTCHELRDGGFAGELLNLYGPTEATVACTANPITELPPAGGRVSIGTALAAARLYVLDDALAPVPVGGTGELYVGGSGVGRGYLHRPGATAQKFVADQFAADGSRMYATGDRVRIGPGGVLEYLGRADTQLKISGHRVEPVEVERVLQEHPQVHEIAVTGVGDAGEQRLVAFVIPAAAGGAAPAELRAYLRERLPAPYVPAEFFVLETMPLDAHDKRDWAYLRGLAADRTRRRRRYEAPRTPTESYLVALLEDLLRVEAVSVHDDFFSLGGHSLLAARGRMRIQRELEISLAPQAVFENSVVADLAGVIDESRIGAANQAAGSAGREC